MSYTERPRDQLGPNRKFQAQLTLDFETGKIGFEFAPRKKGAKKKTAKNS